MPSSGPADAPDELLDVARAALSVTNSAAREYDDGESFDADAWAETAVDIDSD